MKDYFCDLCSEKLPPNYDGKVCPERYPKCIDKQLGDLLVENKKLKQSVIDWRTAWYEVRDLLGNLWTHHPAIDDDNKRAYYQAHQKYVRELKEKS